MSAKEGQDIFAEIIYQKSNSKKASFLDIGCGDCVSGNNTIKLEEFGWDGFCLDLNPTNYSTRKQVPIRGDVKSFDWEKLILKKCTIGYISLDVDDANVEVINGNLFEMCDFVCMTFETDKYNCGDKRKKHLLNFIDKNPEYFILFEDVKVEDLEFEDWVVNKNYTPFTKKLGKSLSWQECLEKLDEFES